MARKTSTPRAKVSVSAKKTVKAPKTRSASATGRAASGTSPPPTDSTGKPTRNANNEVLARAEADIAAAIESLNRQMGNALATLTELAVTQRGRHEAVVRTAPLDRATATFQRLVAEVVDEQLSDMLPPLIALRMEIAQRMRETGAGGNGDDFHDRALSTLDQVLATAGVKSFDARPGEAFDPLIHLAVGEVCRADLADGAVAEYLQPGFRSSRGRVIQPARVKVNRR